MAARLDDPTLQVQRALDCPASFFRYLYAEVGRRYQWVDRLGWTDDQLRARLHDAVVSLWVMRVKGSPAGYFELERHHDGSVEVAYLPSSGVHRPRARKAPAHGRRGDRLVAKRASGLAAHLHARRPGRAPQLPGPGFSAL